jgi:threonine aldolase
MANFASDNTTGIHPKILAALGSANEGHMPSYGQDPITEALNDRLRALFDCPHLKAFPVFNGSASNGLGLSQMLKPYEAILTHAHSHINADECGLPEFFTGAKLLPHHGDLGKISPLGLEIPINLAKNHAPHASKPRVISITQSTEVGTVYRPRELAELRSLANENNLLLHMDGARFANAVASLGCKPRELTVDAGIDVMAFGGTKNGAMIAEAVIIFNESLIEDFEYRHKRAGQLPSKARFISAQLLALIEDGLWLELAGHANTMAKRLEAGLLGVGGVQILYPVEANAVFVTLPPRVAETLLGKGHAFYAWPLEGENGYRLVTSFATTEAEVAGFIADCLKGAA